MTWLITLLLSLNMISGTEAEIEDVTENPDFYIEAIEARGDVIIGDYIIK